MKWTMHTEHTVYRNPWLTVNVADVELPDGRHLEHYLLRQRPVAVAALVDEQERVLLLWRHRFIPDVWGWELPAGVCDQGEDPLAAAGREAEEETGWRPAGLRPLLTANVGGGLSDCVHHVFWTDRAEHVGSPVDAHEAEKIEWVPLKEIPDLLDAGRIHEASTIAALLRLRLLRAGN